MLIRKSALPMARSTLITWTPPVPPTIPPTRSNNPILTSTLPSRQWARVPEVDAPTIWLESEAAATVGGDTNHYQQWGHQKSASNPKDP